MAARLLLGDSRTVLATLPDGIARCCVTSPPYWGLRDYGTSGQLGLEPTPDAYVANLVAVFREVWRVLADDGTLWLNLGDSYARAGGWSDNSGLDGLKRGESGRAMSNMSAAGGASQKLAEGLKTKDLVGIPWLVAFALRADGWVLRSEIIWGKPNPMPESVRDRPTKSHEQIFLFSKAKWAGSDRGRFAHISDDDARWLALLIDAEGSIVVKRCKHDGRGDTFAPQVSIGNTSEALMREVVRIVGHGSLLERPGKNCRMLYWQLANGVARDFLYRIYPFLIVKQRQARIGIHVDSLTYYRGGRTAEQKQRSGAELRVLESLWARGKECNHFGEPNLDDVPEPKFGKWVSHRYYYDASAIAEPIADSQIGWVRDDVIGGTSHVERGQHSKGGRYTSGASTVGPNHEMQREMGDRTTPKQDGHGRRHAGFNDRWDASNGDNRQTRNARSVWSIATQPYREAHFATFPEELARRCILAGSAPGDTVLDPFGGSGTVASVATGHGRNAIHIDLNPAYIEMAQRRIGPMLCEVPA